MASTKSLLSDYAIAVREKNSVTLRIFDEVWDYALDKGIPLGVNVESVSIRKAEIEASVELLQLLRRRMEKSER